jgi:predicted Zn finger-like uncharacterized protein
MLHNARFDAAMITVCPKCALTLAVTAGDLRVGHGQVRCGRCASVFNALAALQDDLSETIDQPRPAGVESYDPGATDVAAGAAPIPIIDSETGATIGTETIVHEIAPPNTPEPPAPEPPASEQPAPEPSANETLQSLMEDHASTEPAANDAEAAPDPSVFFPEAANDADASLLASANDDDVLPRAANDASAEFEVEVETIVKPAEAVTPLAPAEPLFAPTAAAAVAAASYQSTADSDPTPLDLDLTPPQHRKQYLWLAASVALVILLAGQWVHQNRTQLAARDAWRGPLTRAYSIAGLELQPAWDVTAFEVRRQGEMLADAQGAMRLRASVQNTATHSQPLPLLRVVLLDRFGARISGRDLQPAEYLPAASLKELSLLAPGQRIDAEVALADPGAAAVGFELDACLTLAPNRVRCASQAPATAAR